MNIERHHSPRLSDDCMFGHFFLSFNASFHIYSSLVLSKHSLMSSSTRRRKRLKSSLHPLEILDYANLKDDFKDQHQQYFVPPESIQSLEPIVRTGAQGDKFKGTYQEKPVFLKKRTWATPTYIRATSSQEIDYNQRVRVHCEKNTDDKPFFVHFWGWTWYDDSVLLIFEWIETSWAEKERDQDHDKKRLLDVVHGLTILHESLTIIHGDIKPSNVMIRSDGTAAICDFGCAYDRACISCSTMRYHYPGEEIEFSVMTDLYSIGLILLILIKCHQNPPPSSSKHNIKNDTSLYDSLILSVTDQLKTCSVEDDDIVYTLLGRVKHEFIYGQTLKQRETRLQNFLRHHTGRLTSALEVYLRSAFSVR